MLVTPRHIRHLVSIPRLLLAASVLPEQPLSAVTSPFVFSNFILESVL